MVYLSALTAIPNLLNQSENAPRALVIIATVSALGSLLSLGSWVSSAIMTPRDNSRIKLANKKGRSATFSDLPGPVGLPIVG
ncbi:hypothetical protein HK096_000604, partial [Nowakowskiella sp. JEL0078]